MKNVENMAFQGDILIIKRTALPEDQDLKVADDNIVAHSETGHHHVALAEGGEVNRWVGKDPMVSFLVGNTDIQLKHLRTFDTHETLNLLSDGAGEVVWEIRRQREHTPDGWRRVED